MYGPSTPGAARTFVGSSSPWDSQESDTHARSPTRRKLGVSSGVDAQTPSKTIDESIIYGKFDIDEIIKVGTFDELAPSFVLTTDRDHEELDMEPEQVIDKTVAVSAQITTDLEQVFAGITAIVISKSISYTQSEVEPEGVQGSTEVTVRSRDKMAVADEFCKVLMQHLDGIVSKPMDLIMDQYYKPLVDQTLIQSTTAVKAQCLLKFHQAVKELADVAAITSESNAAADTALTESHAQVVYKGCVDKIKTLYASYMQVKSQYDDEMKTVANISDNLHMVAQTNTEAAKKERDSKVADFAEARKRAEALKSIVDFKFEEIIQCIYDSYPDIAGSASSTNSKKGYALHEYKLPDGILGDTHDAKIASSMIAGLLQIAQAWIEDFFVLVIFLKRIQDNESPFDPVYAPLIADMPRILGKDLGDLAVRQMGKMWSVVARGNQDIVEFNRNNPSVSMFKQITTGGNGEPERKSTVEPKNIISFVCYCVHHHDQGLSDRRRQMTAVMKNAYSLFAEGCIIKACDQLQKHWAQAMQLKVKVDWYSLIHLASDILRHRSPDFWEKLTRWIESEWKEMYTDDCLPKVNEWIADVKAIALRLTNSAPRKYVTQEITAAHASMQAFHDVLDGKSKKNTRSAHVDTSVLSQWECGNVDCKEKIPQAVVDGFIQRREKRGIDDKSPPGTMSLLCTECHEKHSKGEDIVLSDGNVKRHYQVQSEEEKEAAKKTAAKKAKNKAKNERRKARKAEAKKLKEEEAAKEAASPEVTESPAESSSDAEALMKKLTETMEALPGKIVAMAAANMVKTANAEDLEEGVPKQSASTQGGESSSSVVQNLLGAYNRSAAHVTFGDKQQTKLYTPD